MTAWCAAGGFVIGVMLTYLFPEPAHAAAVAVAVAGVVRLGWSWRREARDVSRPLESRPTAGDLIRMISRKEQG